MTGKCSNCQVRPSLPPTAGTDSLPYNMHYKVLMYNVIFEFAQKICLPEYSKAHKAVFAFSFQVVSP